MADCVGKWLAECWYCFS